MDGVLKVLSLIFFYYEALSRAKNSFITSQDMHEQFRGGKVGPFFQEVTKTSSEALIEKKFVSNEKYGHHLCIDTLWFIVTQMMRALQRLY